MINDKHTQFQYELMVHLEWLGRRLFSTRCHLGMTQKQMAHVLGIQACRISQIENGAVDIKFSTLLRIAVILNADPRKFIPTRAELRRAAPSMPGYGVKRRGLGRLSNWERWVLEEIQTQRKHDIKGA